MTKAILPALALAAAFAAGSAAAQTAPAPAARPAPSIDQADVFYAACQQPENRDACLLYMAGYANGALVQALLDRQQPRYCLPPNATRPQQLGAVLAYMKGHLENMLEPTGAVVYKALIAAYPCQAKR
ncbi:Rap1a domain-containing protein [Paraburkholderia tropica]|uniref:Rap1a/Tai family immunity protein n=1 Tax=Paraburkholderia TaxID=1822464 RepID=UPI001CB002C4|nr:MULTISPECIES: Rap1a/Tai family immunity protein [Paraburkholderia]CAG9202939.1 Rap1a domain-containing protein [Paraburkholderia tropica]